MINKYVSPILAGHIAGHYDLPEETIDAAKATEALQAASIDANRAARTAANSVAQAENSASVEAIERALAGKDVSKIEEKALKAASQAERDRARARILKGATETAEHKLRESLRAPAEKIIVDYLRPAHAEVLKQARKALADLEGIEPDPAIILTAGTDEQRDAYRMLKKLGERYAALRAAWRGLDQLHHSARLDSAGVWAEFENPTQFVTPRAGPEARPWPEDPADRLIFGLRNDLRPWLPTRAEHDAKLREWSAGDKEAQAEAKAKQDAALGPKAAVAGRSY